MQSICRPSPTGLLGHIEVIDQIQGRMHGPLVMTVRKVLLDGHLHNITIYTHRTAFYVWSKDQLYVGYDSWLNAKSVR